MTLLDVHGLTMKFGSLVANREVSFSVDEGQIVGLIGPNGSGKTTLFNCVSGLYKPIAGRVVFNGKDITSKPVHEIAQLGLTRTFQIVKPLSDMTVLENVMVGAYLRYPDREAAREEALKCVKLCYLEEFRDRLAGDMTIGNKKRLEVARILATNPKMILLDESVAGLTSTEAKEMVALIVKLREEGRTILMVEHIMEAIMPISDKIVVLSSGSKIAEGRPEEIASDERVISAYLGEKYAKRFAHSGGGVGHE
ncbi:MAG: ABC transporter ATP-binding protein [Synergistaceae bacterium]|nr:ABC transporter ATP-binding protein [Synergistaceae bacterium]